MSVTRTTGTQFAIATGLAASKNMTALSNATNAVATLEASHGVGVGDFVVLTSGWDRANGRVFRASAVATNDVTLEGLNTSDTSLFPPGGGIGSVQEVTGWTTLSQISPEFSVSGGDQNFADITFVTNVIRQQIPTDRNPIEVTLPYFFDLTLGWVATVETVSDQAIARPFRMVFPNQTRLVANAYWSIRKVPTNQDSTLRGQIDLSFINEATSYAT